MLINESATVFLLSENWEIAVKADEYCAVYSFGLNIASSDGTDYYVGGDGS